MVFCGATNNLRRSRRVLHCRLGSAKDAENRSAFSGRVVALQFEASEVWAKIPTSVAANARIQLVVGL